MMGASDETTISAWGGANDVEDDHDSEPSYKRRRKDKSRPNWIPIECFGQTNQSQPAGPCTRNKTRVSTSGSDSSDQRELDEELSMLRTAALKTDELLRADETSLTARSTDSVTDPLQHNDSANGFEELFFVDTVGQPIELYVSNSYRPFATVENVADHATTCIAENDMTHSDLNTTKSTKRIDTIRRRDPLENRRPKRKPSKPNRCRRDPATSMVPFRGTAATSVPDKTDTSEPAKDLDVLSSWTASASSTL